MPNLHTKNVLVAPLNWGLGHATRSAALIHRLLQEGNNVVMAGDGISGHWLQQHFPELKYIPLPHLDLHYSAKGNQMGTLLGQLPKVLSWMRRDQRALRTILQQEKFDLVISDNRPTFCSQQTHCVYLTHQLSLALPHHWHWLEDWFSRCHCHFWQHFDEVWIPDYEDMEHCLSGKLGHPQHTKKPIAPSTISHIGPLSRFEYTDHPSPDTTFSIVAVLSGLEPTRSIWEEELIRTYRNHPARVLIVEGKTDQHYSTHTDGSVTIVPYLNDAQLVAHMKGAQQIIARSGYSTLMDLAFSGLLDKAHLSPTPGQPEQEYLLQWVENQRK